jgi:hypothetical protein
VLLKNSAFFICIYQKKALPLQSKEVTTSCGRSAHKAEGECTPTCTFLLLKNFNNLLKKFIFIFFLKKFVD